MKPKLSSHKTRLILLGLIITNLIVPVISIAPNWYQITEITGIIVTSLPPDIEVSNITSLKTVVGEGYLTQLNILVSN